MKNFKTGYNNYYREYAPEMFGSLGFFGVKLG